jgi:hypothetical protein
MKNLRASTKKTTRVKRRRSTGSYHNSSIFTTRSRLRKGYTAVRSSVRCSPSRAISQAWT